MGPDAISVRGVRDTIDYVVGWGYTILAAAAVLLVVMGGLDPHTAFMGLVGFLGVILAAHTFLSYQVIRTQNGETTGLPATQD